MRRGGLGRVALLRRVEAAHGRAQGSGGLLGHHGLLLLLRGIDGIHHRLALLRQLVRRGLWWCQLRLRLRLRSIALLEDTRHAG